MISFPWDATHPNRILFRACLAPLNTPSDRPLAGSRQHRVILSREAAECSLHSLIGMALDHSPAFNRHAAQRKVGVITYAFIVRDELRISGYLYGKDFPKLIRRLQKDRLGLSYQLVDAHVEDVRTTIWRLTSATFMGASILKQSRAAYPTTWIELV